MTTYNRAPLNTSVKNLPIVEVTEENFFKVLPAIKSAIKEAAFLGIDCELTGLGNRKRLNDKELDLRYEFTSEIARSYAIISLGISCFNCKSISDFKVNENDSPEGGGDHLRSHDYIVQTFDIITLCTDEFSVEVKAHKFLLSHGFDFNKLYAKGVQYYRGCDLKDDEIPTVRQVFSTILEHKKPIVMHNGLVDIMFLYQSFYADLPKKNDDFAADLSDMFPLGIYDTKYIFEFIHRMPATYLEYLYKKMQLKNARRGKTGDWHVRLQFPPYPQSLSYVDWHPYQQILNYNLEVDDDGLELCESFAFHGWCAKTDKCEKSHNINKIVKSLQPVGAKKRGGSKYSGPMSESVAEIIDFAIKKEEKESDLKSQSDIKEPSLKKLKKSPNTKGGNILSTNGESELSEIDRIQSLQRTGGHRAGFDAFMTGFLFATHISEHCSVTSKDDPFTPEHLGLSDLVNNIYLMGKPRPFLIRKGAYAKYSQNHKTKIVKIRKELMLT